MGCVYLYSKSVRANGGKLLFKFSCTKVTDQLSNACPQYFPVYFLDVNIFSHFLDFSTLPKMLNSYCLLTGFSLI